MKEQDESGRRFYKYKEIVGKTRSGGLRDTSRSHIPKDRMIYQNQKDITKCPVIAIDKYLSKQPKTNCPPYFYLQPIDNPSSGSVWYKRTQVGQSTIADYTKDICKAAGIAIRTSHALRRTAPSQLYDAQVDPQLIIEMTGHRTIEGLSLFFLILQFKLTT